MSHWVRVKNLPYSIEDVKRITNSCPVCAELKPRFYKHNGNLIKATSPFERLNLDFKGPLPSNTRNKYLLTIVDEYSRFVFAVPCTDVSTATVVKHLAHLFSVFGIPSYIHSDRGASFMSSELRSFLTSQGIATSRTTPYNPRGNGQIERYNNVIWKTVTLALRSKNMKIECWEQVLDTALHSIRSLLCTATNTTPHERMFNHLRRSFNGTSIPTWLTKTGPVLMKKHVRTSKYDPLVEEVELLESNPEYAHVRLQDGRETTVSTRHLAPRGDFTIREESSQNHNSIVHPEPLSTNDGKEEHEVESNHEDILNHEQAQNIEQSSSEIPNGARYPVRSRHRPKNLSDYVTDF